MIKLKKLCFLEECARIISKHMERYYYLSLAPLTFGQCMAEDAATVGYVDAKGEMNDG